MDRQLVAKNRKYSEEIRAFALTLHFYSAHAYDYVRKKFNNLLPHPQTIRQWYKVVNGEPGFTRETYVNNQISQIPNKENVRSKDH